MQSVHPIRVGAAFASLFMAAVLAAAASGQGQPASPRAVEPTPPFQPALDAGAVVLYDEASDGRLWAVGRSWKASFGADGATYWPRTVNTKSLPHTLSPQSVTVGGVPLSFERDATVTRQGDRVEMDRGSFVEAYELGASSVEQLFVFASMPGAGELVLRIPVASKIDVAGLQAGELRVAETDAGVEFRSGLGRVTYSRAVAIDARGERVEAATRVEDGSVVIHVAADFLARAAYPLVVDPLLNSIFPSTAPVNTFSTDAVYDTLNDIWFFVYEQVFSATDHDVFARMYNTAGTLLGTSTVDNTTAKWETPSIAYMRGGAKCLIVASVTEASPWAGISGRTLQFSGPGFVLGTVFALSQVVDLHQVRPDVGGDPARTLNSSRFLVVWEQEDDTAVPAPFGRVMYLMVRPNGFPDHAPIDLHHPAGVTDGSPSVSKSNGGYRWLITFQRNDSVMNGDVYGVYMRFDGLQEQLPFPISTGPGFEGRPSTSSPIQLFGPLNPTDKYAVAWESGQSPDRDIRVAFLQSTTVTQVINLTALENSGFQSADQIEPSIDCDETQFLVSYSEFDAGTLAYEVRVTDLVVAGGALSIAQSHLALNPGAGHSQRRSQVAAARSTGTLAHRYLTTYDLRQTDQDHDVAGRFVDGSTGGSWVPFCFGDGSGTACPCGNSGAAAKGCANSVSAIGGALYAAQGTPTATDTFVLLYAENLPPNASCLFFQGTNAGVGAAFGDGLRCATGTITRLTSNKVADVNGVAIYPQIGEQPVIVQGAVPPTGGLRTYQVWYRNAAAFCTASTFNLTNGFKVFWAP